MKATVSFLSSVIECLGYLQVFAITNNTTVSIFAALLVHFFPVPCVTKLR